MGAGEDFEAGNVPFELTVRASDGDLTTDTTVTISVTDVRESVSEPSGQDFAADTSTAGRVEVGSPATGKIGSAGDEDWFAVELVAGRTYTIELKGSETGTALCSTPTCPSSAMRTATGSGARATTTSVTDKTAA